MTWIRIAMYSQQNNSISKKLTKIPIVSNQVLSSITSLYKLDLEGQRDKIRQVHILFGNLPEKRDLLMELHCSLVFNKAKGCGKMNEVFGYFAKKYLWKIRRYTKINKTFFHRYYSQNQQKPIKSQ